VQMLLGHENRSSPKSAVKVNGHGPP
jgi:hypothetical protein